MPRRPKPDLRDIELWVAEQKKYWEPEHVKMRLDNDLYHNEHDIDPPMPPDDSLISEPYVLRSGRGGEIVDSAVGILDVDPQYSIDMPGRKAEDAEKWANLVRATIEREQGEDTNSASTNEVVKLGASGIKVLPNPKLWKKGYPKQGVDREGATMDETDRAYNGRVKDYGMTAPIPIVVWHVPGLTWYPLLNGRTVMRSFECKKVTRSWIEARYGSQLSEGDKDAMKDLGTEIELVEYVDDTWCGYYCFGPAGSGFAKELRVWPHRMPLPENTAPVVLIEGFKTGDTRPGYRWKGVLRDIRQAIIAQDFALSRTATMVLIYYWITVIHKVNRGQSDLGLDKLRKTRKFTIGGTNFVLEDEDLQIMGMPNELPDSEALYAKTEARISRAQPPILQGIVEGVSSGYEYNMARDSALTRVKPIARRLAQADADVMRMIFYAVGAMSKILGKKGLTVYVREASNDGVKPIGVSWESVRDTIPLIRAIRDENLPVDLHSKIDAAIKAHNELNLPWEHVVTEIYGAENPEELKEQREVEDIENSDPVRNRTYEDVFAEMELILNEREGLTPEQAMEEKGLPPPAMAEALGLLPPGAAEQIATGQGAAPPTAPAGMTAAPPQQQQGASQSVARTNPRAGTKTKPGGPRRRGGSPPTQGRGR